MHHDVIIIGAGPAGLCLAKALCDLDLKVALVERQARAAIAEPAFDGREIALTHASIRQLRDLGIWQHLPDDAASPLRAARVMEGDCLHDMRIDAALAGKSELGMLVPNQRIREAAWKAVGDMPGLDFFDGARVHAVRTTDDHACVTLGDGLRLEAPLLVAADSRFSETRRAMGIGADQYDFGKSMLVCRMHHEQPHQGVAWEWFGHGQTLALLPLQEHQASVVVTLPDSAARCLAALDVDAFAHEMEQRYGHRLGHMRLESSRHVYPLVGVYARRFVARRFALAGDAAVGMHPVTAHGYNFGLYGVDVLSALLAAAHRAGRDLGRIDVLQPYETRHRRETWPIFHGTNAIVGLFTDDGEAARLLRQAVVRVAEHLPPLKHAITSRLTRSTATPWPLLPPLPSTLAALWRS